MGQSPPSSSYNTKQDGLPFFQGKAEFTELHPVTVKWCTESKKIAEVNDILLSVRAPVGTTNIADQKCCIGRGLAVLRYVHCHKFLFYFLRFIEKKLDEKGTGTTFRAISGDVLRNYPINFPTLPEQRAIVTKIEQLFSELDNGISCLKKAQEQLKVYRQAVLKQAFEGELSKVWREQQSNLPSAKELLDNINSEREQAAKKQGKKLKPVHPLAQAERDALPELPNGWGWTVIENIVDKLTDGEHFRPKTTEFGVCFLSAKDVRETGVDFSDPLFISEETAIKALNRCNPRKGDLLIVSRGATVGRMCVVNTDKVFCLLGSVILIRTLHSVSSDFLTYMMKSSSIRQKIISISGSTAQQAIYLRDIKNITIPYCSLSEQAQIVQEVELRFSVCDNMEATIKESLEKAEALRQSILKKAFEGKLLSDEELQITCNAPDWEPAEKLLERIRSEKHTHRKQR